MHWVLYKLNQITCKLLRAVDTPGYYSTTTITQQLFIAEVLLLLGIKSKLVPFSLEKNTSVCKYENGGKHEEGGYDSPASASMEEGCGPRGMEGGEGFLEASQRRGWNGGEKEGEDGFAGEPD